MHSIPPLIPRRGLEVALILLLLCHHILAPFLPLRLPAPPALPTKAAIHGISVAFQLVCLAPRTPHTWRQFGVPCHVMTPLTAVHIHETHDGKGRLVVLFFQRERLALLMQREGGIVSHHVPFKNVC